MMTRLLCVVALAGLLTGCQATETAQADTVSLGAVSLCNGCGHVKGTDACCAADAAVCACGLHKGSIGCCKIEAGGTETVMICTSCGEFKGSAQCCMDAAAICAGCGLHKGSPACCKLDT